MVGFGCDVEDAVLDGRFESLEYPVVPERPGSAETVGRPCQPVAGRRQVLDHHRPAVGKLDLLDASAGVGLRGIHCGAGPHGRPQHNSELFTMGQVPSSGLCQCSM